MKRLLASLVIVAGFGIVEAGNMTVSLDDVVLLSQRGVSDQTILVLLQSREIGFVPDTDDIDILLEAGVSEEVIRYLLQQTANPPNTYIPVTYTDPYPAYYYRPYYARTSLFFGYSAFPHTSYRYHHRGGRHHRTHRDHGGHGLIHTGDTHGPGHNIASTGHSISRAGHGTTASISHNARSVGHSRSGSTGHSHSGSSGYRGGHSRGRSGGHSGGGHGGGH